MRLLVFMLLLFGVVQGCKRRIAIPSDIIPPERMQMVIWDLLRADEFVNAFVIAKDSTRDRKSECTRLYQNIFRIHHISREEFQKSLSFYQVHPLLTRGMMDSLNVFVQSSFADQYGTKQVTDTASKKTGKLPAQ